MSLAPAASGQAPPRPDPRTTEVPVLEPLTPLQLDDGAALLRPFRHADGAQLHDDYRDSAFGRWLRRSLHAIDWNVMAPAGALHPQWGPPRGDACRGRLLEPAMGYPLTASEAHWLLQPQPDGFAWDVSLDLEEERLSPWLRRVDPHWGHALVAWFGCGQGLRCRESTFPAEAFDELQQALTPTTGPPPWSRCRERPLRIGSFGGEGEVLFVARCDGRVVPGALERVTLLARPPGVERPDGLPDEPAGGDVQGEWLPGIRMLHPRLLWLLFQIDQAFPWKPIHIYSGYRPPEGDDGGTGHRSRHHRGLALDIAVLGVSNEDVLSVCWDQVDVGCGYYPNNKFVHIDIRSPGQGRGVWIDTSGPGQPSHYVDSWDGVVEVGRVIHERDRDR